MTRYTISLHEDATGKPHYDLFLEREGTLKTWRMDKADFSQALPAAEGKDHRLQYLDYEGPVSGGRGTVKIWDTGTYFDDAWRGDFIQVAVSGRKLRGRLRLLRDAEGSWTIGDGSAAVRRATTALLQAATPEPAPTPELEPLHEALQREEQVLVALATQFLKGAPVEWSLASTDPPLRGRIRTEAAKWRHPWLQAATRRAAALDELASAFKAARPTSPTAGESARK